MLLYKFIKQNCIIDYHYLLPIDDHIDIHRKARPIPMKENELMLLLEKEHFNYTSYAVVLTKHGIGLIPRGIIEKIEQSHI